MRDVSISSPEDASLSLPCVVLHAESCANRSGSVGVLCAPEMQRIRSVVSELVSESLA